MNKKGWVSHIQSQESIRTSPTYCMASRKCVNNFVCRKERLTFSNQWEALEFQIKKQDDEIDRLKNTQKVEIVWNCQDKGFSLLVTLDWNNWKRYEGGKLPTNVFLWSRQLFGPPSLKLSSFWMKNSIIDENEIQSKFWQSSHMKYGLRIEFWFEKAQYCK